MPAKLKCPPRVEKGLFLWRESALCNIASTDRVKGGQSLVISKKVQAICGSAEFHVLWIFCFLVI